MSSKEKEQGSVGGKREGTKVEGRSKRTKRGREGFEEWLRRARVAKSGDEEGEGGV